MTKQMTFAQWNKIAPKVEDLSSELPKEFLYVGQLMRAKIKWKSKIWFVTAWRDGTVILNQITSTLPCPGTSESCGIPDRHKK